MLHLSAIQRSYGARGLDMQCLRCGLKNKAIVFPGAQIHLKLQNIPETAAGFEAGKSVYDLSEIGN